MKKIVVSLAFFVCWVSCAPTSTTMPFVRLPCPKTLANGAPGSDGYFADSKDPTLFHLCSHGKHIADFHCVNNTVFEEKLQVCVRREDHSEDCRGKDGLYPFPGNHHKYILCYEGRTFIKNCAADLVYDESKKQCIFNDKGWTWETDPPNTVTETATTEKATEKVETTTVSAQCKEREILVDPKDKHSYYVCKNGKKIHVIQK